MVNDAWEQRHLVEPISDGMGGTIYNIPYNKGRAMNQWISTFTHVLIPDELSRDAFIESIRAKASMLDEEFPRTKPLRVDVSRNNDIHIEVYPDKNPYNTVFIVHIYPVRGEFRFCESTNPKILEGGLK